ncbi:MAG: hypothetical protein HY840_06160 [Bacteroidetes bacterium]|nr:hypothetical protein [Bacteroidota bacterium]
MSNKKSLRFAGCRLQVKEFTIARLLFVVFLFSYCLLSTAYCFSQSTSNSPYSRYGLGDLHSGNYANNVAMGGISNALQNDTTAPFNINSANPASYASSRLTIFDFGLMSNMTQLETDSKKYLNNRTGLSYMGFVFPVAKWWGTSIGLRPYSSVGYKIYDQATLDSIGTVNYSYEGHGGINQIFWGNGFKIKKLYFGVNVSYLFGDLVYSGRDSFPVSSNHMNTKVIQTSKVNDLYYTFGMQYRQPLQKGWSVTLGATGSMKTNVNAEETIFAANYKNQNGIEVDRDTILYEQGKAEIISIPMTIGGGIVLKKSEKLLLGFDYSRQNWSTFTSLDGSSLLKNSQKIAVGIQFVPNKNAGKGESYLKKIFYRAGFRYTDTYLNLRNTAIKDYTITFGAGFPLRKIKAGETYSQSIINIGVELGQLGTTDNQLLKERYMKVVLGFTLNDRWFIKRKYD